MSAEFDHGEQHSSAKEAVHFAQHEAQNDGVNWGHT